MRCECSKAGFCTRHNVDKTPHLVHLCQTRQEFFQAWEENRGPGQRSTNDRTARRTIIRRREDIARLGRELWEELFTTVKTHDDLERWEAKIPKYGCDCDTFYRAYKAQFPPTKDYIDFAWKYWLKCAVNKKLGKDQFSWHEALTVYDLETPGPKRTDIVAVTALSIARHSITHQRQCIDSWKRFGLDVIAKNTPAEIRILQPDFPDVTFMPSNDTGIHFAYPTQRIKALAGTALEIDKPVLVINSDIELRGNNAYIQHSDQSMFVGIRWNYDEAFPHVLTEFRYGIDAFTFTPHQALRLPDDFPFAIGHAMWDYAVPAIMRRHDIELNIVHHPMLFHRNHEQNWSSNDWFFSQQWIEENLGLHIEYATPDFRDSLEKPRWRYNQTRWIYDGNVGDTITPVSCDLSR